MSNFTPDLAPFGFAPGSHLHTECMSCGRAVRSRPENYALQGFMASHDSFRCQPCAEVAYCEHARLVACGVVLEGI
jgi:hypothetical protein